MTMTNVYFHFGAILKLLQVQQTGMWCIRNTTKVEEKVASDNAHTSSNESDKDDDKSKKPKAKKNKKLNMEASGKRKTRKSRQTQLQREKMQPVD